NFMSVIKHTGIDFSFVDFIVKPAISVTVMGLIVHYSYGILFSQTESNIISLGLSILIGVVVYVVMLPITRAITQEDLEALPRGRSIARLLKRLGLLR
ncbi:MAG TPA: polysaccharide biosynthesis protein, partial [Clostridiales bacterium]|nr:polysaccharide biosynthesis protein [Clostridiales bacterium]